jgi:hypothetical protein
VSALAHSWATHLAHAAWQATLAGLLLLLAVRLLGSRATNLRHSLVMLATLKFVLPPMLPLPTGLFSAAPPLPELLAVRDALGSAGPGVLTALMLLHAAGTLVELARLTASAARLRGIIRRAYRHPSLPLLVSSEVSVPLTAGIVHPVVVFPAHLVRELSIAELLKVLAHERQHAASRDVARNALQACVTALWWFHPMVRLLEREGRTIREERCDDALLASGEVDASSYARLLLSAAAARDAGPPFAAAAISGSPHQLLRRIRRMADPRFDPRPVPRPLVAAALLAAALLLLPGIRVSHSNHVAFDRATRQALHLH